MLADTFRQIVKNNEIYKPKSKASITSNKILIEARYQAMKGNTFLTFYVGTTKTWAEPDINSIIDSLRSEGFETSFSAFKSKYDESCNDMFIKVNWK